MAAWPRCPMTRARMREMSPARFTSAALHGVAFGARLEYHSGPVACQLSPALIASLRCPPQLTLLLQPRASFTRCTASKQPLAMGKTASWFDAGWCAYNNNKPQEARRLTVREARHPTHTHKPIANSTVSRVGGSQRAPGALACWRFPFYIPPRAKADGRLECRAAPPASLATGIDAGSPSSQPLAPASRAGRLALATVRLCRSHIAREESWGRPWAKTVYPQLGLQVVDGRPGHAFLFEADDRVTLLASSMCTAFFFLPETVVRSAWPSARVAIGSAPHRPRWTGGQMALPWPWASRACMITMSRLYITSRYLAILYLLLSSGNALCLLLSPHSLAVAPAARITSASP